MTCKQTIWVGNFKDNNGTFEILVPSCDKIDAMNKMRSAIKEIKEGKRKVITKIEGEENLIYAEEVGDFDYIRN